MNKDIVIIEAFNYQHEYQILKSLLESEGIECFTFDENTVNTDPMITYAIGGIKLGVFKENLRASLIILEQYKRRNNDLEDIEVDGELLELQFFAKKQNEPEQFSKKYLKSTIIVMIIFLIMCVFVALSIN